MDQDKLADLPEIKEGLGRPSLVLFFPSSTDDCTILDAAIRHVHCKMISFISYTRLPVTYLLRPSLRTSHGLELLALRVTPHIRIPLRIQAGIDAPRYMDPFLL